jgi:antirestriction protein ArdC
LVEHLLCFGLAADGLPLQTEDGVSFFLLIMQSQGHTHTEPACYWSKNYGEKKILEQENVVYLHNADKAFFSFALNSIRFIYNPSFLSSLKYSASTYFHS